MTHQSHIFILLFSVVGLGWGVLSYVNSQDREDVALIKIWENAENNIKRDLTDHEKQQIKKLQKDAFSQEPRETLSHNHQADLSQNKTGTAFSSDDVRDFVRVAAIAAMSFGFQDFEKKKIEDAPYFTKRGYVSFYQTVKNAGIKKYVEQSQYVAVPEILCIIHVKKTRDEYNRIVWNTRSIMKIKYSYPTPTMSRQEFYESEIIVMNKEDESLSYQPNLGIRQWILTGLPSEEEYARSLCAANEPLQEVK